jgi:hypothetical protein
VDEKAGRISGGGVAAHHDVGIAALLEVRIEDRFADRAPPSLPLQQVEAAPHGRGRGSVAFSRCARTLPN